VLMFYLKCLRCSRASEIRVLASFTLNNDTDAEEFEIRSRACVGASQQEKGCIYYGFHKERAEGNTTKYAMWEVWSSMAELEAHWQTAHFEKYVSWIGPKAEVVVNTFATEPPAPSQLEASATTGEVRVLARITLKDAADAPELLAQSRVVMAASQQEKGCSYYGFLKDNTTKYAMADGKPTKYAMWEVWASMAELEAHWQTAHFKDYVGWVGPKAAVDISLYAGPML